MIEDLEATTDIIIRQAEPDDAAALAQFAQTSFAETFAYREYPAQDLADFFAAYMAPARFAVQIADPDYEIHLAIKSSVNSAGAIIGFVKTGPVDLPLPASENGSKGLELYQLYLARDAHGSGLANQLMGFVWERARAENAAAVYLSVYSENIRAQRFYARQGFIEIGKNPFAVGSVIDDDRIWKAPVLKQNP